MYFISFLVTNELIAKLILSIDPAPTDSNTGTQADPFLPCLEDIFLATHNPDLDHDTLLSMLRSRCFNATPDGVVSIPLKTVFLNLKHNLGSELRERFEDLKSAKFHVKIYDWEDRERFVPPSW